MSTFSPVGSRSSNGMRMCVCVCVCGRNELEVYTTLAYYIIIIIIIDRFYIALFSAFEQTHCAHMWFNMSE